MAQHLHVLLVEDVKIAQTVATGVLTRLGHEVDIAADGEEAVKLFEKKHYDLIFMDIGLPKQDGLETTKRIRELESGTSHIPIIALSANYAATDKPICLESGMDDFLSKPLTKANAIAMIDKYTH